MNAEYERYLNSDEWKELKVDLIQMRGSKCEKCKRKFSPEKLQPHHLTYERIFKERAEDLLLVCRGCHIIIHKDKIPKVYKKYFGKKDKKRKAHKTKAKRTSPIAKVLNRSKNGKYKTLKDFNTAYQNAVKKHRKKRINMPKWI